MWFRNLEGGSTFVNQFLHGHGFVRHLHYLGGVKETNRKWPVPRRVDLGAAIRLVERFHPYGGAGKTGDAWGCFENGHLVAAWIWLPPPPGAAKLCAPSCPGAVLSLSRMAATPRRERNWHLSKPLKWIMKKGLDRGRYPTLVTYADGGEGHSGHVYKCSGWVFDSFVTSDRFEHPDHPGIRRSIYSAGEFRKDLVKVGQTVLKRFMHRVVPMGMELEHMQGHGWTHCGNKWVQKRKGGFFDQFA